MIKITKTPIKGLLIIEPDLFYDSRGVFFEEYNFKKYQDLGISLPFVQDNYSVSNKNVIRGLHLQLETNSQGKLVTVPKGEVLDVAVDCRKKSKTFGKHFSVILSEKNRKQFWIPRGFAHGLSILSQEATLTYKCDNYFNNESEYTIIYNDKDLNIDWKVKNPIVSEKDLKGHKFEDFKKIVDL